MTRIAPLAAALALAVAAPAQAQGPTIRVGAIVSARTCTLYRESAGSAGAVVTPWAAAAYASWRTWLVKDCVDNFAGIRNALETALASAGTLGVRAGGGRYTVTGRISEVSGGPGAAPYAPDMGRDGFSIATSSLRVVMDVTVRDGAGRIVFGVPLVKTIEIGSDIRVGDFRTTSNENGQAVYARLQQEVALAVARAVAFHFVPLEVTGAEGRTVELNYGDPLLKLGTVVMVSTPGATLRYSVTSAGSGSATARLEGGGDPSRVNPGAPARVVEADSAEANGRLYERVELPE